MKLAILISAVAVLAGFLVIYLLLSPKESIAPTAESVAVPTSSVVEEPEQQAFTGVGTLNSLLALGRPLECMVSYATESATVEGSYFVADSQLRGDFIIDDGQVEYLAAMILANKTLYTWTEIDGERYGMKIMASSLQQVDESAPATREPIPLDAAVSYECTPWEVVDGMIFIPPSNILFREYEALMEQGMEFSTIYTEE